jgi:hypothetical protein
MRTPEPIACGTPAGRKTTLGVLTLSDPDHPRLVARPEHDPRLGLPELRAEVRARERPVRMGVDGQALGGVEQLHENAGRARLGGRAEPAVRIRGDRVTQERPVREPGEAGAGLVAARILGLGDRPDPVLGEVAVGSGLTPAEAVEQRPAPVEAVDPGLGEALRPHAR